MNKKKFLFSKEKTVTGEKSDNNIEDKNNKKEVNPFYI